MVVEVETAKPVRKRNCIKCCSYEVMMVHIDDNLDRQVKEVTKGEYDQKMEEVFPKAGEDLVDFLNRCKLEDSEVMLCPRRCAVFDKKAAKRLQELKVQQEKYKSKSNLDRRPNVFSDRPPHGDYDKKYRRQRNYWGEKSFIPPAATPTNKWVTTNPQAKPNHHRWKVIEVGQGS